MFFLVFNSIFIDSFKFLNKIEISIPIENSNPLKPKIKKEKESNVVSEKITPQYIVKVYKTNQISSDNISIEIKFLFLKKKFTIQNQKIKLKKDIHVIILNFIIIIQ